MALSLKRDLHKTIEKGLDRLEDNLVKITQIAEQTADTIAAKEAELITLEEQLKDNLIEGEILESANTKKAIEIVNAELIRLNNSLYEYEELQRESARALFRKLYPTLQEYKETLNSELGQQTAEFVEGVRELYRKHLVGLDDKREQYNDVKSRWSNISSSLQLSYIAANVSREEGYEANRVFNLSYDNLDDGQLMGLLNGIRRYM